MAMNRATTPRGAGNVDPPATAMQAKIGLLRDKFDNFQSQWEVQTKSRMDREGDKVTGIKDTMLKLEQTLNSEIKRRVEANKALQGMFGSQISSIEERLEGVFVERLDRLQSNVDSLADRIGSVEREFTMTREQYVQDIEDKNAVVAKDVNGMQNAFENEKFDRREREIAIAKRISEHELRAQGAFEETSGDREHRYQQLGAELEEIARARESGDDKFQTFILEEIAAMKNGLVFESNAREEADDDIVQALNHYTKALQDALRIINQH